MSNKLYSNDPWQHSISMLKSVAPSWNRSKSETITACSATTLTNDGLKESASADRSSVLARRSSVVRVIERPTAMTAIIEWNDPTSCRYGHQIWAVRVARVDGVCVLSGAVIRTGDTVYRPRISGTPPSNCNEMMSSKALVSHRTEDRATNVEWKS